MIIRSVGFDRNLIEFIQNTIRNDIDWQRIKVQMFIKETVLIMMAFILWLQKSNGHFLCNVVRIPSCGRHEHALLRSSTFLSCDLLCTLRRFDKKEIIDILLFF